MTFRVKLTDTPNGVGAFIRVPREVSESMGFRGRPKVRAVIAGVPYRGSLMPLGDGTFGLGVLKAIQQEKGIHIGDTITVTLEHDTEERTVEAPPDLAAAMQGNPKAAAAWAKLSYTNRREIARSLEEAKKPETRQRRLEAALERLTTGL
jgi:hypothetical protein